MKKIIVSSGIVLGLLANATFAFASYEKALGLYQDKKYQESLNAVAEVLSVDKDKEPDSQNFKLRYLAAHDHWKLGNFDNAIKHFRKCMEIKPNEANTSIDMAFLLIDMKRYRDAETFIDRALQLKKDPILYYLLGETSKGIGNFWRAKEMYEKAISIDPELYVSYNGLGVVLMKLGRFTQANTAFSAGLSINPKSAEMLNNMGMSLVRMDKPKEALTYFKRAGEIDPKNTTIEANYNQAKSKVQPEK